MNTDGLADYIAEGAELSKTQAQRIIKCVEEGIIAGLKKDGHLRLRIGTFNVKQRDARMGRNPRTGEVVQIAARKAVSFKVGKKLKSGTHKK